LFQASNKRNTETANTIAATKRKLSIEDILVSRYWIGSTGMPWMAPEDSLGRQPPSASRAIFANSGLGILRTGGVETAAVAGPRTQKELVQPDED